MTPVSYLMRRGVFSTAPFTIRDGITAATISCPENYFLLPLDLQ